MRVPHPYPTLQQPSPHGLRVRTEPVSYPLGRPSVAIQPNRLVDLLFRKPGVPHFHAQPLEVLADCVPADAELRRQLVNRHAAHVVLRQRRLLLLVESA